MPLFFPFTRRLPPPPLDLLGITNDWMTSSLTLWSSELDDWSVGVCRVVGTGGVEGIGSNTSMGSLLRDATALRPMVGRLLVRGTGSKLIAQETSAVPAAHAGTADVSCVFIALII